MKIILLGHDCTISFLMEKLKLKQESSLFEWHNTHHFKDILYVIEKIIKERFINIEVREYLKENVFFENTEIHSMHYFLNDKIVEILQRRIDRFLNIHSDEKIIFIRDDHPDYPTTIEEIEKFKTLINSINENCDYRILLLNNSTEKLISERLHHIQKETEMETILLYNIYMITLELHDIEFKTNLGNGDK